MNISISKKSMSHFLIYLAFLTSSIAIKLSYSLVLRSTYLVIILAVLYYASMRKLVFNKQITLFLGLAATVSFVSVVQGTASTAEICKNFIALSVISSMVYSYFKFHDFNVKEIMHHYLRIALIASSLAIVQQFFYLVGFAPGYDMSWFFIGAAEITSSGPFMRVPSFFTEPGYLAVSLTPALFLAINNFITGSKLYLNKTQSLIILIAFIFTFSALGYVGLLFSILFNLSLRKRSFLVGLVSLVLLIMSISKIDETKSRFVGMYSLLFEDLTGSENMSSLIMYNNFNITKDNFLKKPFIGSGFDSYQHVSQISLSTMFIEPGLERFIGFMDPKDMNYRDASTMYFRIATEFGIFGYLMFFYFLYTNRVKSDFSDLTLLQGMCVVFFITYGLRTGQYIRFELWYFIAFYYSVYRYSRIAENQYKVRPKNLANAIPTRLIHLSLL